MPSTLPSSFASAAAGNGGDASRRSSSRIDSATFSEWSRRPGGATQTFRRPSLATSSTPVSHQREASSSNLNNVTQSSGTYVPPHVSATRNGTHVDHRYSRPQMLDLYTRLSGSGLLEESLSDLYVGEGELDVSSNGPLGRWSRNEESQADSIMKPEICLSGDHVEPLGLVEMSDDERERFSTSVNSTLKAPTQSTPRDGQQRESLGTRKMSFSSNFGQGNVSSPTTTRHMNRRRDTSDSFSGAKDPATLVSGGRAGREDGDAPRQTLLRRRTDLVEQTQDGGEKETGSTSSPFGSLRRVSTGPFNSAINGPSSPWSNAPQSAGPMSSMGAFGSFGLGNSGASTGDKRPGLGGRGESRFRGLMSESGASNGVKDKPSQASLDPVEEANQASNIPESGEVRPGDDENHLSGQQAVGSAALGGLHDESPPPPSRSNDPDSVGQRPYGSAAFPPFGSASHGNRGFGDQQGDWPGATHGLGQTSDEPLSPTFTNPYQSPEQRIANPHEYEGDYGSNQGFHLPGLGGFGNESGPEQGFGSRIPGYDPRSQQGVTGRGFGGLAGLGGLGGLGTPGQWSTSNNPRDSLLENLADPNLRGRDLQSPRLAGLGGGNAIYGGGPAVSSGLGQGSRLGSLFPTAMQEQMARDDAGPHSGRESGYDTGRGFENPGFPGQQTAFRDSDSHQRTGRGKFDDFLHSTDKQDQPDEVPMSRSPLAQVQSSGAQTGSNALGLGQQIPQHLQPGQRPPSGMTNATPGQPPAAQQKTMVMPDRIRWIYRDPQGNTQGPWSGLEMHDWYRAGFFTAELLVKKQEDPDYEPLAQLIRRIGNSREPFLVPQIGIPGPAPNQASTQWPVSTPTTNTGNTNNSNAAGTGNTSASNNNGSGNNNNNTNTNAPAGTQPPFANSFPSFGTTLTADQQNALERRKQEEQYLMARQKEHLAATQHAIRQMQLQGNHGYSSQSLQHQSSAQSLQSQPSYGSITSAAVYGHSPIHGHGQIGQGHQQSSVESAFRQNNAMGLSGLAGDSLSHITEESVDLRNVASKQQQQQQQQSQQRYEGHFGQHEHDLAGQHAMSAGQILEEQSGQRHATEEEEEDDEDHEEEENHEHHFKDDSRLRQFQDLQKSDQVGQHDNKEARVDLEQILGRVGTPSYNQYKQDSRTRKLTQEQQASIKDEDLTLTEQVQKAAAKQAPNDESQSPWAQQINDKHNDRLQSKSPLPAPAARRGNQNLASNLATEASSAGGSPVVETPGASSIAPWARETSESQKQPSLKEIQEAEAKRAAKEEEIAQAARRAALEREIAIQQNQVMDSPGLPSSSTWGNLDAVSSPAATTSAQSPWAKTTPTKQPSSTNTATRKTLQQIQKEEQDALSRQRKAVAAAAAAATTSGSVSASGPSGKRYADLAGKITTSSGPTATGAWTTVGAGGKTKAPASPAPPSSSRIAPPPISATVAKAKPVTQSRNVSTSTPNAMEEFKRWAVSELKDDLKEVRAEDFVDSLMVMPDALIGELVHQSSKTISSQHFAEEFIKRKGLAAKGKAQPVASSGQSNENKADGWSEVARKGPVSTPKEESNPFKIVATKKKAGKK